uniref:Uncharacterized protein n=1 Tax=Zea mays TaxID=4577 RepID=C0HHD6_MAIZE|nr:unknown [Zea mays]
MKRLKCKRQQFKGLPNTTGPRSSVPRLKRGGMPRSCPAASHMGSPQIFPTNNHNTAATSVAPKKPGSRSHCIVSLDSSKH